MVAACALTVASQLLAPAHVRADTESAGDIVRWLLPGAATAISLAKNDREGLFQLGGSFMTTDIVVRTLKNTISVDRQLDRGNGLGPNTDAFPSGHTANAFSAAAFLDHRYGWKYGLPAYLAAGFVGFSRIDSDNHEFYQVATSAMLAWSIDHLFTSPFEGPAEGAALEVDGALLKLKFLKPLGQPPEQTSVSEILAKEENPRTSWSFVAARSELSGAREIMIVAPDTPIVTEDISVGSGFSYGVDFGYRAWEFGEEAGLRGSMSLEGQLSYYNNETADRAGNPEFRTLSLMAGPLFTFDAGKSVEFYFGLGAGFAWMTTDFYGSSQNSDPRFAYEWRVGARYPLWSDTLVGIDFRRLRMDSFEIQGPPGSVLEGPDRYSLIELVVRKPL